MGSKHTVNIGPGNNVGAMAIGDGAIVEGSVSVGGHRESRGERMRLTIDIRGATSPAEMAGFLGKVIAGVMNGSRLGTVGFVTGSNARGCAWKIENE